MTRRLRMPTPLAVAILALAAVACGGAGATNAPGASPGAATAPPSSNATAPIPGGGGGGGGSVKPACELLTDADFKAIANVTVAAMNPEPVDTTYENVCRWTFAEGGELDLGMLNVDAASRFDRTVEFEGAEAIAGLGDRAVRLETSRSLLAMSGDTMLDLFAIGMDDDLEQQLLARALQNLGG
jgi:hypothetical protein